MGRRFRLGDFRPDPRGDVREEMESHRELEVEALVRGGMDEAAARAKAEARKISLESGETEAARYAVRRERRLRAAFLLETVRQDLHFALRTHLRAPGISALTLLLLALGIGVNTALFSVLRGVFLEPLDLPDAGALVFIRERTPETPRSAVSFPDYQDFRSQSRGLADMGAYLARHMNLTDREDPVRVRGAFASASLFRTLGVEAALGRTFAPVEDLAGAPVVVVGHALWEGRYGSDPDLLGKTIEVDGEAYTVIGVMPKGFQQPDAGSLEPVQLWLPIPENTDYEPRASRSWQVLGRLAPGVALPSAAEEMDGIALRLARDYPETNGETGVRVEAVHAALFGEVGSQLSLVLGASFLVLLVACGNIASLLLARAADRRSEMAVRGALGGGQGRILRQLLTESALLAFLGGMAGILTAWWSLDLLKGLIPPAIPRVGEVGIDGTVLLFALGVSLVVGLVFGLAPALSGSRVKIMDALRVAGRRDGRRRSRLQGVFVVSQFALSLVLANAALLLLQSYGALRGTELGFATDHLLTMNLALRGSGYSIVGGRAEFYDELLPRLSSLPGVQAVGATSSLPLHPSADQELVTEEEWSSAGQRGSHSMDLRWVTGDFFPALRLPLLSGRLLERGLDDPKLFRGSTGALVSQSAAGALWPGEEPLGKRFSLAGDEPAWITVVGVVGDVQNQGLGLDPTPGIYLPYATLPPGQMTLALRTVGDPMAVVGAVQEEIRRVDPLQAISEVRSMEDVVGEQLARREFYTTVVAAFALLALVLAAVGIFGVLAHQMAARTREIGILRALGAQADAIVGHTLRDAARLAGAGLTLGVGGVLVTRRVLGGFVYGVRSVEPGALALAVVTLLVVALLAAFLPARRASRVDPAEALRGE